MTHNSLFTVGTRFSASRFIMLLVSLLLLLSVVLAACGGGPTNKRPAHPNSLTMLANETDAYPRNFNPYSPSVISGTQGLIYETLLSVNRLSGKIDPWLASSYQLATDAQSITFHLRQGVIWSDGQPFTSDDVVFTLNLILKNPSIDLTGIGAAVKDVAAPDSSTVVVTLSKPFNPITWILGGQVFILSKHAWSSVKGDPAQYADPNPIGTGPYIVKSFSPQLIDLIKNPKFRQAGKLQVDEVKIPAYSSNDSAQLALQKGQIDWTNLFIPNLDKTYVALDKQHNHYWFPSSDDVMLYLNLTRAPFNDLQVRKAISLALNREDISKIGEAGYEPPANPTGLVGQSIQSYIDPQFAGIQLQHDPATAGQTLESDSWTKGSDGIYTKNGKQLAFSIIVVSGYTDYVADSQVMAQNLQAAGMKVTVNAMSNDAFTNALQNGDYDAGILWTNPGPTPYYIYDSMLRSTNSAPIGQPAPSNYERWMNPATDQLLDQYASSTDPIVQKQAIYGLEKIMVEQLPSIPLTAEPYWYQYSTAKFVGWPDATHPYAAPGTAVYPDIEYVILNLQPVS
ncbi:MAG TPA: ABC transporter substrate-binding protein [Ktedonobacteraceae bacterium]|nr:ABC transporter substrate-binding protein [Ktedonobacteraceae bacterium]